MRQAPDVRNDNYPLLEAYRWYVFRFFEFFFERIFLRHLMIG